MKKTSNATTWTTDRLIFLKDKMDSKPFLIHDSSDLKPEVLLAPRPTKSIVKNSTENPPKSM